MQIETREQILQRQKEQHRRTVLFDVSLTINMTIDALKKLRPYEPLVFQTEDGNFAIPPRFEQSANWLSYELANHTEMYSTHERVVLQVIAATMQLIAYKMEHQKQDNQIWLNTMVQELDKLYEAVKEVRKEN